MKKFDVYELIGVLADALGKSHKDSAAPAPERKTAPTTDTVGSAVKKTPSADKNTTIEMIRRHDLISRRIAEREKKRTDEE